MTTTTETLIRNLTAHFFELASDLPLSTAVARSSDRPSALGAEYYHSRDSDVGRAVPLSLVAHDIRRQQTLLGAFARQQGLKLERPEGPGGPEGLTLDGGAIAWAIFGALEDGDAARLCVGIVRALAPRHTVDCGVTVSAIDESAAVAALATGDIATVVDAIERGDYCTDQRVLAAAEAFRAAEAIRIASAARKDLQRQLTAERKAMAHYQRHQMTTQIEQTEARIADLQRKLSE